MDPVLSSDDDIMTAEDYNWTYGPDGVYPGKGWKIGLDDGKGRKGDKGDKGDRKGARKGDRKGSGKGDKGDEGHGDRKGGGKGDKCDKGRIFFSKGCYGGGTLSCQQCFDKGYWKGYYTALLLSDHGP